VNASAGATARDYFSLFQLEPVFALDETALERAYHALLDQFHPDRYAGKPEVEQRVAAQLCADINSGYRILSDEVCRAEYLLQQAGVDLVAAERAGVESIFLMTQISLREQLEELDQSDSAGRQSLTEEIEGHYALSRNQFAHTFATNACLDAARHWQEMCYLSKLLSEPKLRVR
tara:strand:+ start:195 stop:719 length:525 start_codon:yes stop_codon:yes gene_type:complete